MVYLCLLDHPARMVQHMYLVATAGVNKEVPRRTVGDRGS